MQLDRQRIRPNQESGPVYRRPQKGAPSHQRSRRHFTNKPPPSSHRRPQLLPTLSLLLKQLPSAIMSGDKSYMDSAKETLGSVQQKASDVAGQAYETVTGGVSLHSRKHYKR